MFAKRLPWSFLPRCLAWLTESDIARAYEEQMTRMAEQGITSICDMGPLCRIRAATSFATMCQEALARAGKLTLRAHMYPRCSTTNHAWKRCRIVMRATSSRCCVLLVSSSFSMA